MSAIAELARYTYAMFRPPAQQTVSEWADANRVLVSESSAEPGAWRTDRAPYQREIMDAFTPPGIWQIVIMASAQVGKSEIELNMMGCAIDNDPGPMLYIQPTDKVAEDYSKRRIAPMINACPTLRQKVFKARSRDAMNTITMKTFPGGSLAIIGANSVVGSDIEPYTIAAGNPARVLRKRFDPELTELLLRLRWWDKETEEINALIPVLTCGEPETLKKELKKRMVGSV